MCGKMVFYCQQFLFCKIFSGCGNNNELTVWNVILTVGTYTCLSPFMSRNLFFNFVLPSLLSQLSSERVYFSNEINFFCGLTCSIRVGHLVNTTNNKLGWSVLQVYVIFLSKFRNIEGNKYFWVTKIQDCWMSEFDHRTSCQYSKVHPYYLNVRKSITVRFFANFCL